MLCCNGERCEMNFCFFSRESHTKFIYTYICTALYGYPPAIECKLYRYGVIVGMM